MDALTWVLVHSPIVGPDTWEPVAEELRARGAPVVVPVLDARRHPPFWSAHVASVVDAVTVEAPPHLPLVVVGHSGAGQLLAHVCADLTARGLPVGACIFADAGLPTDGASRLAQLRDEAPGFAEELEATVAAGGSFPEWTDGLLAGLVPDPARRRRLLEGVRQLPAEYWTEPIPARPGWRDLPCAALILSDGYGATAAAAADHGWPLRDLRTGNHFLLLADPAAVAEELQALAAHRRT